MSERARKRIFTGVALLLLAALALAVALGPRGRDLPPLRSESRLPAGGSASIADAGSGGDGRRSRGRNLSRGAARRQARRFLDAFLRYQSGQAGRRERAELDATATPRVRDYLLPETPRGSARRARLAALRIYGPRAGRVKASAALAYGARGSDLFEFVLARRGRAWRVSELYP